MKEFDENAVCPKCGHPEVTIRYHNGVDYMSGCYEAGEHLHRTCARCNHWWREKCLDAIG